MAGISATTTGAVLLSANKTLSEAQQAEADANEVGLIAADIDPPKLDTVNISTRAQKIQKLNEEFFSAGPRAFNISAAFIDRLKE